MEGEDVKKEMGKKLVAAMEAEKAREILLKVIEGDDLYTSILYEGKGDPPKKLTKKRKLRSDKGTKRSSPDPVDSEKEFRKGEM